MLFGITFIIWVLSEILCILTLEFFRRKFGIYFFSKNNPNLSTNCIKFYKKLIKTNGIGKINEVHSGLGWILRSNLIDGNGIRLTTSGRARSSHEYSKIPSNNRVRVSTYGDCLTFGEGVPVEETWQYQMEQIASIYEVLNFGTEGYGPGQIYLRYLESLKAYQQFHITIFSIVSTNVFKPLNIFRPFYAYEHGLPLAKPGFVLEDNKLICIPNPLPSLSDYQKLLSDPKLISEQIGKRDYYFNSKYMSNVFDILPSLRLLKMLSHELSKFSQVLELNGKIKSNSTALKVTAAIFDLFHYISRQNQSIPLFLFLPLKSDIKKYYLKNIKVYQAIIDHFNINNYRYLDLLDVMNISNLSELDDLFIDRHFSAKGNRIIAKHLIDYLSVNRGETSSQPEKLDIS